MLTALRLAIAAVVVVAAVAAPAASAPPREAAVVRPGIGIGEVTLGMSIREARKALGQPLRFEPRAYNVEAVRRLIGTSSRYLVYSTRDKQYMVWFLGRKGGERLVRISTASRRARTAMGVGVGTVVSTIPQRLRALHPTCKAEWEWIRGVPHDVGPTDCVISSPGGLTMFFGSGVCTVALVRYQGCPGKVRVTVSSLAVESALMKSIGLTHWDR